MSHATHWRGRHVQSDAKVLVIEMCEGNKSDKVKLESKRNAYTGKYPVLS